MDFDGKIPVKNPSESANPISKLLFLWVLPLFKKGYGKELNINDLYDTPQVHRSEYSAAKLEKALDDQLKSNANNKRTGSARPEVKVRLWKALVQVHKWDFLAYLGITILDELFVRVVQPIYLRKLVQTFKEGWEGSQSDQMAYAGVVCLCSLFRGTVVHQWVYIMFRAGLSCRTATSSLIYRKTMRLNKGRSFGHLMNLLSNDVARFEDRNLIFIPYLLVGPIQMVILLYFLWQEMGMAAFGGVGFVCLILPTQVINAKLAAKFRGSVAKQTDERSRIMNEIVMAIRVIKCYAWEKPFSSIVQRIRGLEVKELSKWAYLRGFFLSLYTFSTRLASFFVILAYVLSGNRITADKAFFCVAVSLTIVESMVFYFSAAVSGIAEISVSMSRIQDYLFLNDESGCSGDTVPAINTTQLFSEKNCISQTDMKLEVPKTLQQGSLIEGSVSLENVTASWDQIAEDNHSTLKNLNLDLNGDKVVMIVGSVGSGKTSLLHLLISQLPISEGRMTLSGRISYASQEPWIFPGNIRQNILFGQEMDKLRYDEVIVACALEDDFKQLPNGDLSIVGERGITLSGGQKARVNLARALYRQADIYLLDDPLSAVDPRVSRHIFDNCLKKYLKGSLRILVSHQLVYLPKSDHVILLKDGRICAQGTYEELNNRGIDFVNLMSTESNNANNNTKEVEATGYDRRTKSESAPEEYDKPEDNVEVMVEGAVTLKTYWHYISAAKSPVGLIFVIVFFLITQMLLTTSEYWLSVWTDAEEQKSFQEAMQNSSSVKGGVIIVDSKHYLGTGVYEAVYAGLVTAVFIFCLTRSFAFFRYSLRISNKLHNTMFSSVVRAPTKFFDDNPSGRILNRFTKDMGSIDELLPPAMFDTMEYFLQMLGVIAIIVISNVYLAIPTLLIVIIFWAYRVVYVKTSRDVKRLESIWKSPVFTHVASSVQGLSTIKALDAESKLIAQFDEKQDVHTAAWFAFMATGRCFAVWAETTGTIFMAIVTFSFLLFSPDSSGGTIGLVVTSTLALSANVQWAMRQSAEMQNHMTAVERAVQYTQIVPEAPLDSQPEKKPPQTWPEEGSITFQNVSLSYGDKDVLKYLNFRIEAKEKIGIVGRTGAGKSSIISSLFRLTESRGQILIDDIDIFDLGLQDLRKQISIIPQDPILFSGTVRYNLDPFSQFEDGQLWKVIQEVQLNEAISSLEFKVNDGGSNFSVGQRQLVCLARAILRQNKIIVMDEATANVDPRTDEFIQNTIRNKFEECTILTIAHRLHSVMDCDRILVLEKGCIMEYDHPHILFQNPQGFLRKLARHTGDSGSEHLQQLAKNHFNSTRSNSVKLNMTNTQGKKLL